MKKKILKRIKKFGERKLALYRLTFFIFVLLIIAVSLQTFYTAQREQKLVIASLTKEKIATAQMLAHTVRRAFTPELPRYIVTGMKDISEGVVYARVVEPTGLIWYSTEIEEAGKNIKDIESELTYLLYVGEDESKTIDYSYHGKEIRLVVSGGAGGGKTIWLGFSLEPVKAAVAQAFYQNLLVLGILISISSVAYVSLTSREIGSLERKLNITEAQMLQSSKDITVGTIAGGVAHDLNTPLGAILMRAQALEAKVKDKSVKEGLRSIADAARYCKELVLILLKQARARGFAVEKVVDINQAVKDAKKLLEFQLSGTDVEMKLEAKRGFKATESEIMEIILNLLTNAKEAVGKVERRGKIIMETKDVDGFVEFTIADNGCGIPERDLQKIYEPFYTTKPEKGVGLGLYITRNLVKKFGGTIEVESKLGVGTTFKVKFPCEK
ncbi:MAG: HAMP domain-containing sensor histidine kinase [Candidatus Aenigmarchaeota archaeon]|nr:HAMP domain-containing sensor histidine kinase [Candidatus Aenigmarchaeota archaeon]